jgi:hypothetical protein
MGVAFTYRGGDQEAAEQVPHGEEERHEHGAELDVRCYIDGHDAEERHCAEVEVQEQEEPEELQYRQMRYRNRNRKKVQTDEVQEQEESEELQYRQMDGRGSGGEGREGYEL